MRALLAQPDIERRATLAGVNLFFSALLGANLGGIGQLALGDYIMLVILLAGAVTGLFTIAVSKRMRVVVSTTIACLVILGGLLIVPDLHPTGLEGEMDRIVATLVIWLILLIAVRFTPNTDGSARNSLDVAEEGLAFETSSPNPETVTPRPAP